MLDIRRKTVICVLIVILICLSSVPVNAEATGGSFMDAITFKLGKWKTNESQSHDFYYKVKSSKKGKYTFTLKNPENIYMARVTIYDSGYKEILSEKQVAGGETYKKTLKLKKKKWYYVKVSGHCKFKLKKK